MDLVGTILGHRPVPLDVVLEDDGARYLKIRKTKYELSVRNRINILSTYLDVWLDSLGLEQMEEEDGIVLVYLH